MPEKVSWTWDTIEASLASLFRQGASFEDVDVVVGIEDGGVIPAMLIHKKLKFSEFKTVHPGYGYMDWLNKLCDYDHILFVDDINDSGNTCRAICHMMGKVFGSLKSYPVFQIATLCRRYNSTFKTGITGVSVDNDVWIKFPWEEEYEKPERDRYVELK